MKKIDRKFTEKEGLSMTFSENKKYNKSKANS